jgi:hypothetical protein
LGHLAFLAGSFPVPFADVLASAAEVKTVRRDDVVSGPIFPAMRSCRRVI